MTTKILAFDIGIKNLAYCVIDQHGTRVTAMNNVNLLPDPEPIVCHHPPCKLVARFQAEGTPYCKRHLPKSHPVLPELSKAKLPTNKVLKELVREKGCTSTGVSNAACVEALSKRFAIPYQQPKHENASKASLESIHDALRAFVRSTFSEAFQGCTHVLLENQPVFKNPHMKSVQVLLFATLREAFLSADETPEYHFVHAKKKVADAKKGDAGYTERKSKSEDRLRDLFESRKLLPSPFYTMWKAAKKKSDMADALCMCVDRFGECANLSA
jgi:hypothetical protein